MLARIAIRTYVDPFGLVCHGLRRTDHSPLRPQPQTWKDDTYYTSYLPLPTMHAQGSTRLPIQRRAQAGHAYFHAG